MHDSDPAASLCALPLMTPAATWMLRRAGRLAGKNAMLLDHLLSASACADDAPEPPRATHISGEIWDVLSRARNLAVMSGGQDEPVNHLHLAWAARETLALAAGLDLNRLRFARFLAQRSHGAAPQLREVAPDVFSRFALKEVHHA